MRVLVIEDNRKLASVITRALREQGCAVDVVHDGIDGVWLGTEHDYDTVVLDVGLPDIDGFEVCRRLRAAERWAPIVMLTERDATDDRVTGLDCGADDYVVKPFELDELLARIRALQRRAARPRPTVLTVGDLSLDPATRRVARGETTIDLSATEFTVLEMLMRRPGTWCRAMSSSREGGTSRSTATRTSSPCTSRTSATRSIARSAGHRSKRSAAPAIASWTTAVRSAPLRLRVTAAFTAAMAVLLVAIAGVLHVWLRHELIDEIDTELRLRAARRRHRRPAARRTARDPHADRRRTRRRAARHANHTGRRCGTSVARRPPALHDDRSGGAAGQHAGPRRAGPHAARRRLPRRGRRVDQRPGRRVPRAVAHPRGGRTDRARARRDRRLVRRWIRPAPHRADATSCRRHLVDRHGPAPRRTADPRRARAARDDLERDARPARRRCRTRALTARPRQPRAAHAGHCAEGRARPCARATTIV